MVRADARGDFSLASGSCGGALVLTNAAGQAVRAGWLRVPGVVNHHMLWPKYFCNHCK